MTLLRHVKNLREIELRVVNPAFTQDALKKIATLPDVRAFTFRTDTLTEKDCQQIASLAALEQLTLIDYEITDEQAAYLSEFKNLPKLKSFHLVFAKLSPKIQAELRNSFPKVADLDLEQDDSIQPFKILNSDDAMLKLKKLRFNSALTAFRVVQEPIPKGRFLLSGVPRTTPLLIDLVQKTTHAALDMNDRQFALRFAEEMVRILEGRHEEASIEWKAGKVPPEDFYALQAQLYEMKILRVRLQEKMPPAAPQ